MVLNISFSEISDYIKSTYNKNVTFSRVASNILNVSYEQSIVIKTVKSNIKFTIEEVTSDSVTIAYQGGFGINVLIGPAIVFLKSKYPELNPAIIQLEGLRIRLELSHIHKLKPVLKKLELQDIQVLESSLAITAKIK